MNRPYVPALSILGVILTFALSATAAEQSATTSGPSSTGTALNTTAPVSGSALDPGIFARVNSRRVTHAEFHATFDAYLRKKYYHGRVPDEDLLKAREAVTDQIVTGILLSEEAIRRNVVANAEEVERRVANFDQQNAKIPEWQRDRERVMPHLRTEFEDQLRVARLEQQVRDAVSVTPEESLAFYRNKPELFTEPERLHVHAILLGVDPSSPTSVWDAALVEAESIIKRIRGGANFAEIARMVSADPSSQQGGDMGYVHMGMMPDAVQTALATYKLGEVGEPIRVLQGVGIFRVDQRIPPRLRDFESVKERAGELLLREKRDQTWTSFVAALRSKADVVIAENRPVATAPNK